MGCHDEPDKKETSCCASKQAEEVTEPSCHSGGDSAQHNHEEAAASCCSVPEEKTDWLLWGSAIAVIVFYTSHLLLGMDMESTYGTLSHTSFEMVNTMWWGVLLGAIAVGVLGRIPNAMVMSVLGKPGSKRGVVRATIAGLMLDLCNHGILMVGMGLYRKGASLGQTMAFLIASPWNSLTLTLVLVALIGLKWTLLFIVFSMVIAWISGIIFDLLVKKDVLPSNPHEVTQPTDYKLWPEVKKQMKGQTYSVKGTIDLIWGGLKESKMVLRWLLFGIVLVSVVRAFVDPSTFGTWFGATIGGLFLTLLATTLIEVCSEGSSPIAADLVNRAGAPGNGFVFLMAGAATDYTEIMALKDTTKSWKIALFLPLVTVPQVMFIGWIMNTM